MKIVKASWEIIAATEELEKVIEYAGRVCYKSEGNITEGSAEKFVEKIRGMNHESVLEHGAISVKFICDRGVSHELVRHRIASFSQESTRYCNYTKGKFDGEITVIDPRVGFPDMSETRYLEWKTSCEIAEKAYQSMISAGATAQEARSVLPNSLKTEVVVTANPREWRHILKLRTAKAAHPQMQELMLPLLTEFQNVWPSIFKEHGHHA